MENTKFFTLAALFLVGFISFLVPVSASFANEDDSNDSNDSNHSYELPIAEEKSEFWNKDQIFYPVDKDKTARVRPTFKMYGNKQFKGTPAFELTTEELKANGRVICKWGRYLLEPFGSLFTLTKERFCSPSYFFSGINEDNKYRFFILADKTTPEYFEIKYESRTLYINPKELKGYVLRKATHDPEDIEMGEFTINLKDYDHLGYLSYLDIYSETNKTKPSIKFFDNKEFNGVPKAQLTDIGLVYRDKVVCKWRKDYGVSAHSRMMYLTEDYYKPCWQIGPVSTRLSYGSGPDIRGMIIFISAVNELYYEVDVKGEKLYLKPDEVKSTFEYIDSKNDVRKKNVKIFQETLKSSEALKSFYDKTLNCIATKDLKCVLGKLGLKSIEKWVEHLCQLSMKSTYKCAQSFDAIPNEVNEAVSAAKPDDKNWNLPGYVLEIFWTHIVSCSLNDFEKMAVSVVEAKSKDENYTSEFIFLIDNELLKDDDVGKCKFIRENNEWHFEMKIDDPVDGPAYCAVPRSSQLKSSKTKAHPVGPRRGC
jgi:hypothetical protein